MVVVLTVSKREWSKVRRFRPQNGLPWWRFALSACFYSSFYATVLGFCRILQSVDTCWLGDGKWIRSVKILNQQSKRFSFDNVGHLAWPEVMSGKIGRINQKKRKSSSSSVGYVPPCSFVAELMDRHRCSVNISDYIATAFEVINVTVSCLTFCCVTIARHVAANTVVVYIRLFRCPSELLFLYHSRVLMCRSLYRCRVPLPPLARMCDRVNFCLFVRVWAGWRKKVKDGLQ